jgi:imidazolonepropionase-like amidohydrolase
VGVDAHNWVVHGVGVDDGAPVEVGVSHGLLVAEPEPGAQELPGRYVLGGLVDAHVHLALDLSGVGLATGDPELVQANLRSHLDAGVLLVRDVGAPVGVRVGGDHDGGPLTIAAGRFLAPPGGYIPGLYEGVGDDRLVDVALQELAAGSGWVKLVLDFPEHFTGPESFMGATPNYPPDLLRELCRKVHKGGGRVAAHVSGPGDAGLAVEVGVDSVEHGVDLTASDLEQLGERGGAWTPTLTTVWRDGIAHSPFAQLVGDQLRQTLVAAATYGVTVLAGSDATPHGTIADEVALLAEFGLEPAQALAAASAGARRYLGHPGLVTGQPADLVTYATDPRHDPDVLRHPAAVLRRGRRVR